MMREKEGNLIRKKPIVNVYFLNDIFFLLTKITNNPVIVFVAEVGN